MLSSSSVAELEPNEELALPEQPVLDPQHLASLRAIDESGETLRVLSALFLEGTPLKAGELARAVAAGNVQRIESAAHDLQGSGGVLGASALVAVAGAITDGARKGRLPDEAALAHLRATVDAALAAVSLLLSESTGGEPGASATGGRLRSVDER